MNDSILNQSPKRPYGHIVNDNWIDIDSSNLSPKARDDLDTAQRLLEHLNIVKELEDHMDAVDYLSENAERLAENPVYKTTDTKVLNAITDLGASGDEVNFELFKYAIEVVLEGYRQMSIISLSGVTNGN